MHAVDGAAADQAERIGAQLVSRMAVAVEHAVEHFAAASRGPRADGYNIAARHGGTVSFKHQLNGVRCLGGVKLIHIIADRGIQARVHGGLAPLVQAQVQDGQRLFQRFGPVPQGGDGIIGAGVIHGNQLILFKVLVQHGIQRLKKPHGLGTIVVQVDHSRDKILFFICHTHTFNTSSRSYTVLILPESTLTSIGSVFITRTTVGRESSISLAFKIGFMLNRLP